MHIVWKIPIVKFKTMTDAGYEKHEGIVQASDVYIHRNFKINPFKNKTTATKRNVRNRRWLMIR